MPSVFADMPPLTASFVKVGLSIAAIVIALVAARARRLTPERIGLRRPRFLATLAWLALYVAFMLATNAIMHWRGPWDFTPWIRQGPLVSALRVLAVGILGPIAEELIFRGVLFARVSSTPVGVWGAAVLLAILWGCLHYAYAGDVIALIIVCGLLLGAARVRTGSVWVPVLMHIAWNLYAVW
jgi:membrane protease YdiL (CAAX protease family)